MTATYLPNFTSIAHMKNIIILNGCDNSLLYVSQEQYFGVVVHKVSNNHSVKQNIHGRDFYISMRSISINDSL